ncbi:hypothetical protein ABT072_48190 [Streptomyces sp. NPDC002589]|uniref:hypothetical protein n=1 Tax=Streptomyces sp. NPDC002589 TaxID=3154420 RepID=UPI00332F54BC
MSPSLARCVGAVAQLLDVCGPLEPVRLCMSDRDVQVEVCASDPAASVSLARLAAATDSEGAALPCDIGGVLTADLDEELVLVGALAPPVPGAVGARTTSTSAAAGLLRTLAPWTAALDQKLLQGAQLWVEDHGRGFTVRLLATAASSDDLETVAAAAGAGLVRLRIQRTDSGLDGRGSLPCGRTVHLGVAPLS